MPKKPRPNQDYNPIYSDSDQGDGELPAEYYRKAGRQLLRMVPEREVAVELMDALGIREELKKT